MTTKKNKNHSKYDLRTDEEELHISDVEYRKQKKQHLKEKRLDSALKTKNIREIIDLYESDE